MTRRGLHVTLEGLLADHVHAGHARLGEGDLARFRSAARQLPPAPASILDAGCGVGVLADWLHGQGYDATGIDVDATLMARMAAPHVVGSVDALPFGARSFDAIVASEVLEHLPVTAYQAARLELARVARSVIVVTVPNAEPLESASTRCPLCSCVYSIHGHVRSFTPRRLAELLPGWRLAVLEQVGPWKARHRTFEWYVRRRMLGRWPRQPGAVCPQCAYMQPGGITDGRRRGRLGRALRFAASVPWRERWWLTARYEREA